MTLQLRAYQRAAIDAIYGYFDAHDGHPLLVLPTASGKSLVAAAFIQEVLSQWPDERIIILTHVRELISQNFAELLRLWPEAPAGIYSAGLNRRDVQAQILFAGIQSVHRKAYAIQRADLVLVDEAHLIPRSANTTYRRFLDDLGRINPQLKIIGLTATPYRLDSGMLHTGPDALFDDIAFEVSVRELIDQSYLAPLISKQTSTQLDVSGVDSRGGEFIAAQLEAAVDQDPVTQAAIDEVVSYGRERRSWLLFCAGVDHARHVCDAVMARGVSCAAIFGHTPKAERDSIIAAFKRGQIRALASTNGEGNGDVPTKVCPACQTINALAARVCADCGYLFPGREAQLDATATTRPILSTGRPQWVDVNAMTYDRHEKPDKPPSLKVSYHCGLLRHHEWVCLEHEGYPRQKAASWWRQRAQNDRIPLTVDEALARTEELRQPLQIAVRPNGRFLEVAYARFA